MPIQQWLLRLQRLAASSGSAPRATRVACAAHACSHSAQAGAASAAPMPAPRWAAPARRGVRRGCPTGGHQQPLQRRADSRAPAPGVSAGQRSSDPGRRHSFARRPLYAAPRRSSASGQAMHAAMSLLLNANWLQRQLSSTPTGPGARGPAGAGQCQKLPNVGIAQPESQRHRDINSNFKLFPRFCLE